jgi:hypothetical protein
MRTLGSILHGAYGDYYEQALCLKHFVSQNPEVKLKLFAASPYRMSELSVLDFSFAGGFELWSEISKHAIDEFLQFQVMDPDLRREVIAELPASVKAKLNLRKNLLPWDYLRPLLPLPASLQIGLSECGRERLPEVAAANGISGTVFQKPTIGFLWRYRSAASAIRPYLQPSRAALVEKYSKVFRQLIEQFDCTVLVCGMNLKTTDENRTRVDAKFAEFGLDIPESNCIYLRGLSWALELEILSRCTVCMGHSSGFTEALYIKRARGVVLVDPPYHYLLKLLRHRMPLFDFWTPRNFIKVWRQPYGVDRLYNEIAGYLKN